MDPRIRSKNTCKYEPWATRSSTDFFQYGIDKSASIVPKTRSRAEQILKDIEIALDEWLRSIPEHRMSSTFELV